MRAVVTGGAGFIGSHVADALVARGDEVHIVDDLSSGRREQVPAGATLHEADIRDGFGELFDAVRPETVFHLAAQMDVRRSIDDPLLDAQVNVLATVGLLETARAHGARVLFASTGGAIYGECDGPAPENAPRRPLAPYGTSKLCAEEYLATFNRLYGSAHVSFRFGNVYGPRQDPHGEAGVVAIFLRALHEQRTPRIYGDGSQTRDYVFVGDVVRAMVGGLGPTGGVFNIGTGEETSVVALYEACRSVAGSDLEAERAPARLGEIQRSVIDPALAGRELGWRAETPLERGLAATFDWIKQE